MKKFFVVLNLLVFASLAYLYEHSETSKTATTEIASTQASKTQPHLIPRIHAAVLPKSQKIVGYYPEWAIYRDPSFKPLDIDPTLVTHINYAFAKVDVLGNVELFDAWAATGYRKDWQTEKPYWGNFEQLKELKEKNPNLKILISIGGWTLSEPFSVLATLPESRQNFIVKSLEFCERYGFDGIDIDWEFPGFEEHGGRPEDTENFTTLLSELYHAAKTHSPALLVTIAAPAGYTHINNMQIDQIHNFIDWANLMAYDFHGPWPHSDPVTNHNAPLLAPKQGDPQLCIHAVIEHYIAQGFPPQKLILGLPIYGRTFGKADATTTGLFSSYEGPGSQSPTAEPGMRFFGDCKTNLLKSNSGYARYWDNEALVPYLFNATTADFISFDDEESLGLKVDLIHQFKLGGAMVWELGQDSKEWDAMHAINKKLSSETQVLPSHGSH